MIDYSLLDKLYSPMYMHCIEIHVLSCMLAYWSYIVSQ